MKITLTNWCGTNLLYVMPVNYILVVRDGNKTANIISAGGKTILSHNQVWSSYRGADIDDALDRIEANFWIDR